MSLGSGVYVFAFAPLLAMASSVFYLMRNGSELTTLSSVELSNYPQEVLWTYDGTTLSNLDHNTGN